MNSTGIFDPQIENLKLMETKSNRLNLRNRTQFVKMTASGAQLLNSNFNPCFQTYQQNQIAQLEMLKKEMLRRK